MKLYIKTFGCQMNEYDSSRIRDSLNAAFSVESVAAPELADIILVNTCSIREKAQEKLFSYLGTFRRLKTKKPNLIIGVGGCVASQEGETIRTRAPLVNIIFGPQTLHRLPELIREHQTTQKPVIDIRFPEIEKFDKLPAPRAEGPSAYVSIQEGCSKYCSYCIVPYTRGEEINRPFRDIISEISHLAHQGVREITLLGQNVNAYQANLSLLAGEVISADLALLIHYVAEIEGIERIRFTTSHPQAFSDRLIEAYQNVPKLANHLHLPVQSGSNQVLAAMKRGYTREQFIHKIKKLRAVRPDISISSDFIVGFPGETDTDFQDTLDLVNLIQFDQSFSFIFSPRPGTPAADLALIDDTSLELKKQRLKILQDSLLASTEAINKKMVGTLQKILVIGPSKKNPLYLTGRTENNRLVYFTGSSQYIGQLWTVKITESTPHCLIGRLESLS